MRSKETKTYSETLFAFYSKQISGIEDFLEIVLKTGEHDRVVFTGQALCRDIRASLDEMERFVESKLGQIELIRSYGSRGSLLADELLDVVVKPGIE